jgi:hypothetical protein
VILEPYNNGSLDSKDIKNQILALNVSLSSEENLIATEDNSGIKYKISNSQLNITDDKENPLLWNELKDVKLIEVHYSRKIKEVSLALFEKLTKISII